MELFHIENFANLESSFNSNDGIDGDVCNDALDNRTSHESIGVDLVQKSDLEDNNNNGYTHKDSNDDNNNENSRTNNYSIKSNGDENNVNNSNHNSNNNNTKGLWKITRALHVYGSHSYLEELSCTEEEGNLEEESSDQPENETKEIADEEVLGKNLLEKKDQEKNERNESIIQHQRKKNEDINRKK